VGILLTVYIAAAIFGVGITIIDLIGLFGHHGPGSDTSSGHSVDHGSGDNTGNIHTDGNGHYSGGDHSIGMHPDVGTGHSGADHSGGHIPDSGISHDTSGHTMHEESADRFFSDHHDTGAGRSENDIYPRATEGTILPQLETKQQRNLLLRSLGVIRNLVYFCFGFGPISWIARVLGQGEPASFIYGLGAGLLFTCAGFLIRRVQRNVLDSQVQDSELYMEHAIVIVPIEPGKLGKVRIDLSGVHVDRYAKARDPEAAYAAGSRVHIVEAGDEYVTVSDEP
jgi:hypothetical protein